MYTIIRHVRLPEIIRAEGPAFLVSLVCAEAFYKFHSFTLECICFLGTWFVVSSLLALGARRSGGKHEVTGRD